MSVNSGGGSALATFIQGSTEEGSHWGDDEGQED